MSEFDLNLSTRPFPAYRATNAGLAILLVILLAIAAWQAYGFVRYSSLISEIRDTERNSRVQSEALGHRLADLERELNTPEATAKLSEVNFLNELIARKTFSWTEVFSRLENLVPNDVHLMGLSPEISATGPIVMRMEVRGRTVESISQLISALEQSPSFENVVVSTEQKTDSAARDVDVSLSVNYFPSKEMQ